MTKPFGASLFLLAGIAVLGLFAGAARTSPAPGKVLRFRAPIEALAIDGTRVAYDLGISYADRNGKIANRTNKVLVWNLRTNGTTKVSGRHTAGADDSSTGARLADLAIAGPRVAWMFNVGGNTEGDDYVFASSVTKPKERQVATAQRLGDNCAGRSDTGCAGRWLGGVVGSGNLIALNRWTTDAQGSITGGGLYVLNGTQMKPIASGASTVEAASADGGRVAVLRADGTVGVYSSTGTSLLTVTPTPRAREIALSGRTLVVLEFGGKLAVYDSHTGTLRKTFTLHGDQKQLQALAVHGNVAVYSKPVRFKTQAVSVGAIHAINLSTGKDRTVGKLSGEITLAEINSAGLVYASNGYGAFRAGNGTLVFVPFARVAAAVR